MDKDVERLCSWFDTMIRRTLTNKPELAEQIIQRAHDRVERELSIEEES